MKKRCAACGHESSPPAQKLLTPAESVDHRGSACLRVWSCPRRCWAQEMESNTSGRFQPDYPHKNTGSLIFIQPSACVTESGLQLSRTEREKGFTWSHKVQAECFYTSAGSPHETVMLVTQLLDGLKMERQLCYCSLPLVGHKKRVTPEKWRYVNLIKGGGSTSAVIRLKQWPDSHTEFSLFSPHYSARLKTVELISVWEGLLFSPNQSVGTNVSTQSTW